MGRAGRRGPVTVYVDALRKHARSEEPQARRVGARNGDLWCHLLADESDCEELHEFAARLGCHRGWYQERRDVRGLAVGGHYDLTPGRRAMALKFGAVEVDRRQVVELLRKQRTQPSL